MYNVFSTTVISEPDDVTVCEGETQTTFACALDSSITSDDVQWYRILKNTSTTERVEQYESDMNVVPVSNNNSFTTTLYITNARKSYTGYYWVGTSLFSVCNVSLTVTSM